MSLRRALERLPRDRATVNAVREVLVIFRARPGQTLSSRDVVRRLPCPDAPVGAILVALAEGFVLEREGDGFRYGGSLLDECEVRRFLERSENHNARVQTNIARFRERYGMR